MVLAFSDCDHYLTTVRLCCLSYLGAMQTPEAGADSTSTVPLQTTVPVQPTGSTQQVPVQQQVHPACLSVCVFVSECSCQVCTLYVHVCISHCNL